MFQVGCFAIISGIVVSEASGEPAGLEFEPEPSEPVNYAYILVIAASSGPLFLTVAEYRRQAAGWYGR